MIELTIPATCLLCGRREVIIPTGFRQVYPQFGRKPILLDWWECSSCQGWFVHPVPSSESISRYWETAAYNDRNQEGQFGFLKNGVYRRVLQTLIQMSPPGPLLDYGCNFGQFLLMARDSGFAPVGFDAYETAAEIARKKGFEVRTGWFLDEVGFPVSHFTAITAIDSFCYSWHPYETLTTFYRLLKPGGVLAMRLSNKRFLMGGVRQISPVGPRRERKISTMLQAQFHSISVSSLRRILLEVGFDGFQVHPRATTAPWSASGWGTRISYLLADTVYYVSLRSVNVYPGILLFARKKEG